MRKTLIGILLFALTTTISFGNSVLSENLNSTSILINKKVSLPSDYVPKDLVSVRMPANKNGITLRKDAEEALNKMYNEAHKNGIYFEAASGYRSYSTQEGLYKAYSKVDGEEKANTYSAKPGQSEHQTGLAIDVANKGEGLSYSFGSTKAGAYLVKNSYKFGFILRYPKEKESITGYVYEPWHFRYLGEKLATKIYKDEITLEEYYEKEFNKAIEKLKIENNISTMLNKMFKGIN